MVFKPILGLVSFAIGLVLIIWGLNAAHSGGSRFSETFLGNRNSMPIYLVIGGAAATIVGVSIILASPKDKK